MQEGLVILSARYGALEAIRKTEQREQGERNGAENEGPSAPEPPEQASSAQDRFAPKAAGKSLPLKSRKEEACLLAASFKILLLVTGCGVCQNPLAYCVIDKLTLRSTSHIRHEQGQIISLLFMRQLRWQSQSDFSSLQGAQHRLCSCYANYKDICARLIAASRLWSKFFVQ